MRKTCFVLLLLALLPAAAWAQGYAPSVVVVEKSSTDRPAAPGEASDEATAAAQYLENQVAIGLDRLCVRSITDQDLRTLLGYEKAQELLGGDSGGKALAAAAEAQGAQYVITVSVSEQGGEMSLSASMTNAANSQTMASDSSTTPTGPGEADAVESLAKQFVDKLSNLPSLESGCEPHWSGIVTLTLEQKTGSNESGPVSGGGTGSHYSHSESYSTVVKTQAMLILQKAGSNDPNRPMARVTSIYDRHNENILRKTYQIKCGAMGAGLPNPYRMTNEEQSDVEDEHGKTSLQQPFIINLDSQTGDYSFSVSAPDVTTKRKETAVNNGGADCVPKANSVVTQGDGFQHGQGISGSGRVDPKNPVSLSGQVVTGDMDTGRSTTVWNLKFVKPKKKK